MDNEMKQPIRPQWLVMALAVSSAVMTYRLSGAIVEIVNVLNPITWKFYFELLSGLLLAFVCAYGQHVYLEKRSLTVSKIFLIIFIVLALLPFKLSIKKESVAYGFDLKPLSYQKQAISPVKFEPPKIIKKTNR